MFECKHLKLWRLLIVVSVMLVPRTLWAEAPVPEFIEGVHFKNIDASAAASGEPEVIEFLWYGCQVCYALQGDLAVWRKQYPGVKYRRIPAVVNNDMMFYARVFYTAEALAILEKIHIPLFTAIHAYRRNLNSALRIEEFFAEYGVSKTAFYDAFNSAYVSGKVRRARLLSQRYGLLGAPSLVVNQKFRIDPTMVRSASQMIQVMDDLATPKQP